MVEFCSQNLLSLRPGSVQQLSQDRISSKDTYLVGLDISSLDLGTIAESASFKSAHHISGKIFHSVPLLPIPCMLHWIRSKQNFKAHLWWYWRDEQASLTVLWLQEQYCPAYHVWPSIQLQVVHVDCSACCKHIACTFACMSVPLGKYASMIETKRLVSSRSELLWPWSSLVHQNHPLK